MGMDNTEKEILICLRMDHGIQILIPKKRGAGFLKVPAGHHNEKWLHEISYDIFGLNGILDIDCQIHSFERSKLEGFLSEIMPIITKRFPFEWRVVDRSEFDQHWKY